MLFNDFYKEFDRNTRRWRVIVGLAFLAAFGYIAFIIAVCSNQPTQNDIEQIISKSSKLSELNRYCDEIPKPSNFQYQFKTLGGNSGQSSISYWYKSSLPFSTVRDFYISYLEKEGWTLEDLWDDERSALPRLLQYRKGKRTISVQRVVNPNAEYAFGCSLER